MRKLAVFVLAAGLLALMVAPVSARPEPSGTVMIIAVPSQIPLDGEIDRIVVTGTPESVTTAVRNCFSPAGVYPVGRLVIGDTTQSQAGMVDGVIMYMPYGPGTRAHHLGFMYVCQEHGIEYNIYGGATS